MMLLLETTLINPPKPVLKNHYRLMVGELSSERHNWVAGLRPKPAYPITELELIREWDPTFRCTGCGRVEPCEIDATVSDCARCVMIACKNAKNA